MGWLTVILAILATGSEPAAVRMGPGMEVPRTPATVAAGRGDPLLITGTVHDEDARPAAGVTLHVWQANATGRYGPSTRRKCCYLQATVTTDEFGRYALRTIVPGGYGGAPPHVHIDAGDGVDHEIFVEGRPRRLEHDLVLGQQNR